MRAPLMAVAMLFPMASFAAEQVQQDAWSYCKEDKDCAVGQGVCNPVALNTFYKEKAEAFFRMRAKTTKCPKGVFWQPKMEGAGVRCMYERCTVVGKEKSK